MEKRQITIQQFNEIYTIEVTTKAIMYAQLESVESDSLLDYGPLEEAKANLSYQVYNRHNMNDFDVEFEVTEDVELIDQLKEFFEFIDEEE